MQTRPETRSASLAALMMSVALLSCAEEAEAPLALDLVSADRVSASAPASPSIAVRGELVGTATATLLANPSRYRIDVTATGVLTALGRASATWALPDVILDLANGQGVAQTDTWSGTITLANGDGLTGRYTLRNTTVPVDVTGNFTVLADLVITGGTGRTGSANGRGVAVVRGNVFNGRIRVQLSGQLAAPRGA